ncbi:MAG: archaellin/type IV pilin N-terminal domain-containing protein [Nitrosopumilus sp.]
MDTFEKSRKCRSTHRAVAPVIATLLMVAIAVVGGTIIFVFSQGFFNQAQVSGTPTIESVKILGYDARDIASLVAHDGLTMTAVASDPNDQGKNVGEYVVVYIKNDSSGQVLFSEIRLGGAVYTYIFPGSIPDHTSATVGTYAVMDNSTDSILDQAGVAQPGETIGIIFDLSDNFPIGRDTQFKLTTTNGAVFVGTVVMGQNAG